MPVFEYKVVPAPTKGQKAKGVRKPEERFSYALQELMNDLSREGWEYQRAETLPSIERAGLTGSTTEWRNVLVFRRPHPEAKTPVAPTAPATGATLEAQADEVPEMTLDKTTEAPAEPPLTAPVKAAGAPAEPSLTDPVKTAEEGAAQILETAEAAPDETPDFTAAKALSAARDAAKTET